MQRRQHQPGAELVGRAGQRQVAGADHVRPRRGVWHWVVYNLPADSHGLPAGAGSEGGKLPEGAVTIRGDAGRLGYIGACPPPGDGEHRYIITLYALDRTLDLPADANPATLGFNLNGKILASGRIMATYSRPAAAQ